MKDCESVNFRVVSQQVGVDNSCLITGQKYEEITSAINSLSLALTVEEKYELLLCNYFDFEKEVLEVCTESMIFNDDGYRAFASNRLRLERRIINLLTTSKLYVDAIKHDVKRIGAGNDERRAEVDALFSNEYDCHFEYRFIEQLRNHAQHQGSCIDFVGRGAGWNDTRTKNTFTVSASISKDSMSKNHRLKPSVIAEMPEKLDLKIAIRVYIECLGSVHRRVRELIEDDVDKARDTIVKEREIFNEPKGRGFINVQSVCVKTGEIIDNKALMLDWDDVRLEMKTKNKELISLKYREVSNH